MARLFVYGTLRPGSNNQHADRLARIARHIGTATVAGRLYRVAQYPGLAPSQSDEDSVTGDLFEEVTAELLRELDDYEGDAYRRELMEVTMPNGQLLSAYVYCYAMPTAELEWIPSGDWSKRGSGNS